MTTMKLMGERAPVRTQGSVCKQTDVGNATSARRQNTNTIFFKIFAFLREHNFIQNLMSLGIIKLKIRRRGKFYVTHYDNSILLSFQQNP